MAVVKILIDIKEYNRLLLVERSFSDLEKQIAKSSKAEKDSTSVNSDGEEQKKLNQKGEGTPELTKVMMENQNNSELETPSPGILPSITLPPSATTAPTVKDHNLPWYYLGDLIDSKKDASK